jgi:hypothetical protein
MFWKFVLVALRGAKFTPSSSDDPQGNLLVRRQCRPLEAFELLF